MLAVMAGIAVQINEFVRNGYRVVCVGPCEELAGPLEDLGAALPDTITPNDDRELQAILSARSSEASVASRRHPPGRRAHRGRCRTRSILTD
jgi:hypothetical protein